MVLDLWKERKANEELKSRIREELGIIAKEIGNDLKKEAFQTRAFSTEAYTALNHDLIRKLDAEMYRAVRDAYVKIDRLSAFSVAYATRNEKEQPFNEIP